jgi:hypothetical protein
MISCWHVFLVVIIYTKNHKEGCAMAKRPSRFTPEQLELMTTHELADLLTNTATVLRRLPNVPIVDLESDDTSGIWARHSQSRSKKKNNQSRNVDDKEEGENRSLPDWAE